MAKRLSLGFLLLLILGARFPARAGTGPMEMIREKTERILGVLRDPALKAPEHEPARRKKIEDIAYEAFDWPEISRRALGIHWRGRSDAEQKEFTALFTDLVRNTYLTKIDRYSGEQVRYKGEEVEGNFARVSVEIVTATGTEIPVVYSLMSRRDAWLIYDVAVEGVRLVNNYRAQFSSMLDRMPFARFMAQLRDRIKAIREGRAAE